MSTNLGMGIAPRLREASKVALTRLPERFHKGAGRGSAPLSAAGGAEDIADATPPILCQWHNQPWAAM